MTEPLSRRRSETQRRLLRAAQGLFAERSIAAASVEQICERAGYTRGAFYSNFTSKDDLVLQMLTLQQEGIVARVARALAQTSESFAAQPEDRRSPHELLDVALRVALSSYNDPQHPDSRDPWQVASLVGVEIALYAVREPAVRQAYLANQAGRMHQLGELIEQTLAMVGLRLTVAPAEAGSVLTAVFQVGSRQALLTDTDIAEVVAPRLGMVLRCMSEPIEP